MTAPSHSEAPRPSQAGAPAAGSSFGRRLRHSTRWSGATLGVLLVVALFADCLASDLPLVLRFGGQLWVLPNVTRPGALRRHDNQTLAREMGPGDFAVWPPVPYGPLQTQPGGRLDPSHAPSSAHWLGTDDVGRDVLAGVLHGTRIAFLVGILSVLLSAAIGLVLGALAGTFRGPVDGLVSWLVAVMTTFPSFLLVLAVQGLVRSESVWGIVLVLGLTGWAGIARIVRGEVLRAMTLGHVEAARALGAGRARVFGSHVLPLATGPLLVAATFGMASAILVESGLSFLGIGPDVASWGRILAVGLVNREAWWLVLFPGIFISGIVVATHFFAEGIHEALDPHRELPRRRSRGGGRGARRGALERGE